MPTKALTTIEFHGARLLVSTGATPAKLIAAVRPIVAAQVKVHRS
jgi:hypothetical protein